jgi:hypothetical protein
MATGSKENLDKKNKKKILFLKMATGSRRSKIKSFGNSTTQWFSPLTPRRFTRWHPVKPPWKFEYYSTKPTLKPGDQCFRHPAPINALCANQNTN